MASLKNWLSTITFLLIIIMFMIPKSTTAPTFKIQCSDDATYAANSSFSNNLNTLLKSLSANATANPTGFFSTSVAGGGGGPNDTTVYGVFICRGDVTESQCHDCVSTAVTEQPQRTNNSCPQKKAVTMLYDECMIRYDYQPIYGRLSSTLHVETITSQTDMPGNQTSFEELLRRTTLELAVQAANGPQQTGKKYASLAVNFTSLDPFLYSMVQCTPDLSASDCNNCLSAMIPQLPYNYGARALHPNCYVRYEVYPFLDDGAFNFSSPAAPTTTLSRGHKEVSSRFTGHKEVSSRVFIAILVPLASISVTLLALSGCLILKKQKTKTHDIIDVDAGADISTIQALQYDLRTLKSATNSFSSENRLGEGGFGVVYKGTLRNGQTIAVKKLSKSSIQGTQEFKNEVFLLAKLQHRNLVSLLGFCLAGEEKLLVYEYVPNKSLDHFLFDTEKQGHLNWESRYKIIGGIARGMLYLHQDSRLRIIHRDLKASNVLLDEGMNPKISDFGMAKIFGADQTNREVSTSRIVGTYGYMSPEYIRRGRFSIKSDVYSFGVLLLEIMSGIRNNSLYQSNFGKDVFSLAWRVWEKATPLEFVDPTIRDECSTDEVMRCLHIALLCIDESIDARPTMATIVLALQSYSVTLRVPRQPIYYCETESKFTQVNEEIVSDQSSKSSMPSSMNDASTTESLSLILGNPQ